MNALRLYEQLKAAKKNSYFATYEELNVVLDSADFPCFVVVPISKQISFVKSAARFRIIDSCVVAMLDKQYPDDETVEIYQRVDSMRSDVLDILASQMDDVQSMTSLDEFNKFDAGVIFAAIGIDFVDYKKTC